MAFIDFIIKSLWGVCSVGWWGFVYLSLATKGKIPLEVKTWSHRRSQDQDDAAILVANKLTRDLINQPREYNTQSKIKPTPHVTPTLLHGLIRIIPSYDLIWCRPV